MQLQRWVVYCFVSSAARGVVGPASRAGLSADECPSLQLCDFLRFGVKYAEELYNIQPAKNSAGVWKWVVALLVPRAGFLCVTGD